MIKKNISLGISVGIFLIAIPTHSLSMVTRNDMDKYRHTELHTAARRLDTALIQQLLQDGDQDSDINAKDDMGLTPLDALLDRMRWGGRDKNGLPFNYLPAIQVLLQHGATTNYYELSDFLSPAQIKRVVRKRSFSGIRNYVQSFGKARTRAKYACVPIDHSSKPDSYDCYVLMQDINT